MEISEQDQAKVDQAMDSVSKLYDDTLASIKKSKNPGKALGMRAGEILNSVVSSMQSKGKQIPPAVAQGIFKGVTEDLFEIAAKSKALPIDSAENMKQAQAQTAKQAATTYRNLSKQRTQRPVAPPRPIPEQQLGMLAQQPQTQPGFLGR